MPNSYFVFGIAGFLGLVFYALMFFFFIAKHHDITIARLNLAESAGTQDDIEDLKSGRITLTHISVVAFVVLSLFYIYFYTHLEKAWATWGGVNVTLVGVVLSTILGSWMVSTSWFKDQRFRTPVWVYLTVIGGIILSMTLGILGTENENYRGRNYDETQTNGYYFIHSTGYSPSSSASSLADVDCDGDGCVVMIVIVIVVLAVVYLSIGIPHFWVAGCLILLTILLLLVIQDVRATSPQHYRG